MIIKKQIQRITLTGSFLFLSVLLQAQISLKHWTAEDHSGQMKIEVSNDTLDITAPKGLTLWYNTRLTGDYEITYRVKVLMQGGKYDRLSDLNCFWAANDPQYPNDLYARATWRQGIFQHYRSLNLFYVGYGGNNNTTTRFRQYFGGKYDMEDPLVRPVIKEYTDAEYLLKPNEWYHVRISVRKGITTYYVNGEELFRLPIKEGEGDGHFGLRLLQNHVLFTDFNITIPDWVTHGLSVSMKHAEKMFDTVKKTSLLPRSIQRGMVQPTDWTSGFFPGTLWYLYSYTADNSWRDRAEFATELLNVEQFNAFDHDVGFKMYCSYGNGWLLTGRKDYRKVIVRSAKTLSSRYSYKTGLIMSWEEEEERNWCFPVIIDNMMNLELMMEAYKLSGDTTLRQIAVSHADKTLKYHYRKNLTCPHVVDYDPETGEVRKFDWNNGSDDTRNSTWSRGQSWGLYGFVMMYRETGDLRYLRHAENIADFLLQHPNMPDDLVPYWDYSAPERSEMRDASAAAVMASALMELSTYSEQGKKYFEAGERQLRSLSSPEYLAKPGTHKNFILKHATGNFLQNSELDGALSYADYYYVEGLLRYVKLFHNQPLYTPEK